MSPSLSRHPTRNVATSGAKGESHGVLLVQVIRLSDLVRSMETKSFHVLQVHSWIWIESAAIFEISIRVYRESGRSNGCGEAPGFSGDSLGPSRSLRGGCEFN